MVPRNLHRLLLCFWLGLTSHDMMWLFWSSAAGFTQNVLLWQIFPLTIMKPQQRPNLAKLPHGLSWKMMWFVDTPEGYFICHAGRFCDIIILMFTLNWNHLTIFVILQGIVVVLWDRIPLFTDVDPHILTDACFGYTRVISCGVMSCQRWKSVNLK